MTRWLSVDDAVALIDDGDVVAVSGCLFNLVPEELCAGLERRFLATGSPRDLTAVHLNVFGLGAGTGMDHLAHEGMVSRVVGSSFPPYPWASASPWSTMLAHDKVAAWALPAGAMTSAFQAGGAGRPGALSKVGLGTFVDPRLSGGALTPSAATEDPLVSIVDLDDDEWLLYRALRPDVSLVLGSVADKAGNVTFENEPLHQAAVSQSLATKAAGGTVIVQVKDVVDEGVLDARLVKLPALLTDVIVHVPEQQSFAYGIHPGHAAFTRPTSTTPPRDAAPSESADTWIARRAVREVAEGDVVNLGAGIPVREMPFLLRESAAAGRIAISIDHGSLGGTTLGGTLVASHWNPTAFFDSVQVYEYYGGVGLDVAFLGAAEIDGHGHVNVARAGDSFPGIGGFMDIADAARTVVFCSPLRAGGARTRAGAAGPLFEQEGRRSKFVPAVSHICFRADRARDRGQRVLYVTERAVFGLNERGLVLTELAPGLDAHQLRALVECDFDVADRLATMPQEIYAPRSWG